MATPAPQENPINPKSHPGRNFGALRDSRRYTGTAHYVAAALEYCLNEIGPRLLK